ncbi:site-specific integrase [Phyllobacterium lublinensis]|uniref:site-specific integrase n=1 Tax=Phyllobacterium lublinensis TaxID=2875708 RepID=UPI001CC9F700|nr:site-specific integrase [Phyllobacterium sp. 2063]MBZ9653502.1 site-specific integrase [Phyllobacterium sp. 2063]
MKDVAAIDLPYIETNRSRHGKERFYFRVDGKRLCRLPDNPDSQEFSDKYWAARNGHEAAQTALEKENTVPIVAQPGTFHFLCVHYLGSQAYLKLDSTTQSKRRSIIDSMLLEPLGAEDKRLFAHMPIPALDVTNIEILRDRKKDTPFAADERLKILRQIFEVGKAAKPKPLVMHNTAKLVESFRVKTDGHATMRDDDIAQYVARHGTQSKAVLALTILMYTGVRVSDLALIGPQHRRGDVLTFRVFKGRNKNPTTLQVPVHPILDAVLKLHPVTDLSYMVTEYGRPFSIKGLGNRVSDWFTQAGLPHLTAHSVRKGLATNMAENEATDLMLEGMFGWKDAKASKIYTRNARRARLARQAVSKIDWGESGNILPHPEGGVVSQTATPEKKIGKIK